MNPRLRALIQAGVMLLFSLFLFKVMGHTTMAKIVLGLAAVVLVSGLFFPPAFHAIERFGQHLAHWVGTGLTYLLLVPFYYLVFVPSRIMLAFKGRDPMERQWPADKATYWVPRPPVRNLDQYKKQH